MNRFACLWIAAVVLAGAALAQDVPPDESLTPPPPPPATAAPAEDPPPPHERGVTLSGQQEQKAKRHGRFSAGPGGPLLVFTEVITGMVSGGVLGGLAMGRDGAYLGVLAGGVLAGGAAAAYSYFVPVSLGAAMLTPLGAVSGYLLGLGIGLSMSGDSGTTVAIISAVLAQVGVAAVLGAAYGRDITGTDAGLVAMGSLYATVFTALTMWTLTAARNASPDGRAILYAPAIGMAVGAAAAMAFDVEGTRLFKIAALPLGVGLLLLYLGNLATSPIIAPATAMIGIAATLGLTILFTTPVEDAPTQAMTLPEGVRIMPVPTVALTGRGNRELAPGAGVLVSF